MADQRWVSCYQGLDAGPGRYHPYVRTNLYLTPIGAGLLAQGVDHFLARESKVGEVTKVVEKDVQRYLYQGTDVSSNDAEAFWRIRYSLREVTELQVLCV